MSSKPLRILHIASFDRWTGAAAPALAETEALRGVGADAHYAFVGGNNLEERLRDLEFAHPLLQRHTLLSVPRSIHRLRALVRQLRPGLIHAHLTHDHILAALCTPRGTSLVRTFHAARALRTDPGTRALLRRTAAVCAVNTALLEHPLVNSHLHALTPPPLDRSRFRPDGESARERLGFTDEHAVIGYIGKVAARRGFEEAILTFAAVRRQLKNARMMIIGRGPHRPALERLIADLQLSPDVVWAGYQGDELPQHYRAADVMLFTAPGSDHGHRAVIEAIGCGVPVAAFPLAGLESIFGETTPRLIAPEPDPESLAATVIGILAQPDPPLRPLLLQRAEEYGYDAAARRLLSLYEQIIPHE